MKNIIKKFLFGMVGLLFIFFGITFLKDNYFNKVNKLNPAVLGLPKEDSKNSIDISYKQKSLRIDWFTIDNPDNLFLFVNSEKLTSQEFIEENECNFLSSGGYYKSDYSPTGLLISEYQEKSSFVNSSLSNGIFSINDFATPRITSQIPRDRLRVALQAGPILKENAKIINLFLKSDEEARRMVVGVTGENIAIFLTVYDPNSNLIGPKLKDLPGIIAQFEDITGIVFADAMNLDGGTPTVFYSNNTKIVESSIVGSFFCLQ